MKMAARVGVVQIEGGRVRVAVVKTGGKRPSIAERTVRDAPNQQGEEAQVFLARTLREAVEDLSSRPQVFVLCADGRRGVVRPLTIPFRGAGKVSAAVQFELEPYLAFPIEDLVVDHLTVRERPGETDVLVAGMRHDTLAQSMALFEEAGVPVEGIGVDAAGLTAVWLAAHPRNTALRAVVHFREDDAVLTVVDAKTLLFFRYLPISPDTLAGDPKRAAREIANSLRAFLGTWEAGKPLSALHTTGGALGPGLRDALEEAVGIPVEEEDSPDAVRTGKVKPRKRPRGDAVSAPVEQDDAPNIWEAMAGVAAGAAGAQPAFNFLKGELTPAHAWRPILAHAVFSLILVALLSLGGIGYMYMNYRSNVAQRERMESRILELYQEAFPEGPGVPPVDLNGEIALANMRQAYEDMAAGESRFDTSLLARPSLLDLLVDVSRRLDPEKVELTDLEVRSSVDFTQQVIVEGELKDPLSGRQELEKLRGSHVLTLRDEPHITTNQDNKTTFRIDAMTKRPD